MAMARPQTAGVPTGFKAALIVFVALTVVAMAFTIIMYTDQSNLQAAANRAQEQASQARKMQDEANSLLRAFARDVVGESTDDAAKIKDAITKGKETVLADPYLKDTNIPPDSALLTVLQEFHSAFSANAEALAATAAERDELNEKLAALNQRAEERDTQFAAAVAKLREDYTRIEQDSAADRDRRDELVRNLETKVEATARDAMDLLNKEREEKRQLEEKLQQEQKRSEELLAELARFKPRSDLPGVLQIADGSIVRAVPGDRIVYISLGRRDGLTPGMTFSVYSRFRGIPPDGKGKAAIEVANLFETTAECRITMTTPGEPIVEDDVIANPVYDRSRQFRFVVAGDFDLDFDGRIDDPGGRQVARLIQQWGGALAPAVDTRADFVVLGKTPPAPGNLPEGTTDETLRVRFAERTAAYEAFETVKKEAMALSIPILTRTQFLHFLGYVVPAHVQDDRPAL